MAGDSKRVNHLLQLREEVFQEMEEADQEFTRLRLLVERMESDVRIGRSEPPDYPQTKGRLLPQAEARLVHLYRELTKLEDKINMERC
jgi:hypothetical protein